MKRLWISLCVACAGCTQYAQVQINLTEQIRRGVGMSADALGTEAAAVDRYHQAQRQQLDRAFDEDVRDRGSLTADWVIEHRRAYAAALAAIAQTQSEHAAWIKNQQDNLKTIDEACKQLMTLQSLPLRLMTKETR